MKSLQTILLAAIAVLALVGFNTLAAHGSHIPQPDDDMRAEVVQQLNDWFPDCPEMEWKIRTFTKRGHDWYLRAVPRDRACVGERELRVRVQGPGHDVTAIEAKVRITLPHSGRTRNIWFPHSDVRPQWACY